MENRDSLKATRRSPGRPRTLPTITISEAWDRYERMMRANGNRPNTVRLYKLAMQAFGDVLGNDFDLGRLTESDIERFISKRREVNKPSSINLHLSCLKAVLRRLVRLKVLPFLPIQIDPIKSHKPTVTTLTDEQTEKLIAAIGPPFNLVIMIADETGLRHNEITFLQRQDVDLPALKLHVRSKYDERDRLLFAPKTWQERTIPISAQLGTQLEEYLNKLARKDRAAWLFPNREGGYRKAGFYEAMRKAFSAAGLSDPGLRPGLHLLRRTFATAMCGTTDIETVRALGGWSSLEIVQRYVTTTEDRKRDAINNRKRR